MVKSKFSRNVHLVPYPTAAGMPPWGTTLGVTPTVCSTGRWGQVPAAVGHGRRIPSAVAHGGRIPSAVVHGGKALTSRATAAAPHLYKGPSPYRLPLSHSPSLLQTFGFQPF
jgi:hypothetical protein